MAIGAVTSSYPVILLLDLRVELAELDLLLIVSLHGLVCLDLIHQHLHLLVALLQLGLSNLKFLVYPCNFALFLVQDGLQLFFQLLFIILKIVSYLKSKFVLLLIELFNFFIENLDVQFELLLHLDVVTHLCLVVLQLLLVLLGRQIQRVERRRELTRRPVVQVQSAVLLVFAGPSFLLLLEPEPDRELQAPADVGHCSA